MRETITLGAGDTLQPPPPMITHTKTCNVGFGLIYMILAIVAFNAVKNLIGGSDER